MKAFFVHFLITLAVFLSIANAQRWDAKPYNANKQASKTSINNGASTQPTAIQKVQKMSGGIGAWGYVAIMLSVVLSGLGVYYFILFYPIVCKKERMYDVMEMTTV